MQSLSAYGSEHRGLLNNLTWLRFMPASNSSSNELVFLYVGLHEEWCNPYYSEDRGSDSQSSMPLLKAAFQPSWVLAAKLCFRKLAN